MLKKIVLLLGVLFPFSAAVAQPFDGWRLMPVRSEGEFNRGELGGRAEQFMQGAARCRANPDIVYLSHDCSQTWRSIDGGLTWEKPLNLGLFLAGGQSIEVDPVDCNRVIVVMDNVWDYWHTEWPGIYLSEDGGDHWELVQPGPALHSRRYEHNVAWAPGSIDAQGARRWYVALYNEATEDGNADAAIYISDDYGHTWTRGASLVGHNPVYGVQVSPTDSQVLYLATSEGLYISTDGGVSLALVGDLPVTGEALSVGFDPNDAQTVYAVLSDGLYRSTAAGADFTRVTSAGAQGVLDDARHFFMHPTNSNVFYVLAADAGEAVRTDDGGGSFQPVTFNLPADVLDRRWGVTLQGGFSFVLLSATDDANVIAQSRGAALYRSTDGLEFVNGSTLFEGANCGTNNFNIAFDEVDSQRFAVGNQDIGMYYTDNGADWFSARAVPWSWIQSGTVAWGNMSSLSFSNDPAHPARVISSVGDMFTKRLALSEDNGQSWTLVESTPNYNWRVAFHPSDHSIVYAGDRRSVDGGQTFALIDFGALDTGDLQVMDFCRAQPDTVYAASRSTGAILRSDQQGDAGSWSLYATAPGSIAPFDPIPTFAVGPAAPCDVVYTLDADGDVTRFDGTGWESLGVLARATPPPGYDTYVRAVMVDPRHPEVLYASMFGSGFQAVFRSVDDGATWQDVSYNLFRNGISGINISPLTGEVMVGGCSGTWVLPPPYETTGGIYDGLVSRPSCYDGLQNGDETGVDTGGRCSGDTPTSDGGVPPAGDAGGGDAAVDAGSGDPDGSSGCGCRTTHPGAGWLWIGLLCLGLWLRRRRRGGGHCAHP